MPAEPFSFLHAADLHLEQPIDGLAEAPDHLCDALIDAPLVAAERVFDATLAECADFLILAGDVLQLADASPREITFLVEQFERLAKREIPIYWLDDDAEHWPAAAKLPANVHRFSHAVRQFTPLRLGKPLCRVVNESVPSEAGGLFTIAVAHGEFDAQELAQQPVDYWALGGEHQRQSLFAAPRTAHYAGTPQGRAPSESGPHGCTLASVDAQGKVRTQFIATDCVRWHAESLTLDAAASADDLRRLLGQRMNDLAGEASARPLLVDWTIETTAQLNNALAIELLAWLRDEFGRREPAVWAASLALDPPTTLPVAWYEEDTILGDFLRAVKVHQADDEQPLSLATYLPKQQTADWKRALELSDPAVRHEALRQAAALGAELLRGEVHT